MLSVSQESSFLFASVADLNAGRAEGDHGEYKSSSKDFFVLDPKTVPVKIFPKAALHHCLY